MNLPGADISFRGVVVLLPLATALHIVEEWPRFPRWARRFASPRYTDREYITTHAFTLVGSVAVAVLLWIFPNPWLVVFFFLVWIGPGMFCNALFHAGASVVSRTYCPGTITGLLVYLPLSATLAGLALRDQILNVRSLLALLVCTAAFHTLEVGHNVFKHW